MGKSLELLGLAAFNVFIALILSATFFTKAETAIVIQEVKALTESNVESFITEMAEVSGGQREGMDDYSITSYFMNHVADQGYFISTIAYNLPEMPSSGRTLEMDKLSFISHLLESMGALNKHEAAVQIEYIDIADNGRSAMVTTTNYERGIMPAADEMGETQMIPVMGTSYCEQEIILSAKNIIQIQKADCSTDIDFSDAY